LLLLLAPHRTPHHRPAILQLTITARLLEASGVSRLLGLMSPSSSSSRRSTASSLLGAKGRMPWAKSMTPRAQGQQAGKESPGEAYNMRRHAVEMVCRHAVWLCMQCIQLLAA
jgi:hypothetical protein